MKNIIFVCHGNICRSPMAEFVMKYLLEKEGMTDKFHVCSRATSLEEIGNGIYPPAKAELKRRGIPFNKNKRAAQITHSEFEKADFVVVMDENNLRNLRYLVGNIEEKTCKLLSFADKSGDVADPWYTDRFDKAFDDIMDGCLGFLQMLKNDF